MRPASPTHNGRHAAIARECGRLRPRTVAGMLSSPVAGVAHLWWPASEVVGFVAMVLALAFAVLVDNGSRREVTVAVDVPSVVCCEPAPVGIVGVT